MTYKRIWIYYCVAAAVAMCIYFIAKVSGYDFANEMWTTVWGLILAANMYAIEAKDEKEDKH